MRTLAGILLAGLVLAPHSGAEQAVRRANDLPPEVPAEYDPFAGIDRDGRIPNVARPADMTHPERWRYIPEGRIKPGNLFVGVEYQYWKNKYGVDGVDENVVQMMAKWFF